MSDVVITISWEWLLGLFGVLLVVAYKGNGRFTALETSMEWIKKAVEELKISSENTTSRTPAFSANSPVSLTTTGRDWLIHSGLQEYLDVRKDDFLKMCELQTYANPYEVQTDIFRTFQDLSFEPFFDDKLKKFAFEKGTSMGVMKRIGAIYVRDMCLDKLGMKTEDIDQHESNISRQ